MPTDLSEKYIVVATLAQYGGSLFFDELIECDVANILDYVERKAIGSRIELQLYKLPTENTFLEKVDDVTLVMDSSKSLNIFKVELDKAFKKLGGED